jgi:hypothetical protein
MHLSTGTGTSSPVVSSAASRFRAVNAAVALAFVGISTGHASAALFTPGDLIVNTYGTSSATLADGAPTTLNLIEFSPSGGAPVLTDTLPTADGVGGNSANLGVEGEYGSSSEGNIQLSGNGQYLTLAGYSATAATSGIDASTNSANGTSFPVGTPFSKATVALAQATDTNLPRIPIFVDSNGNVNSTTVLNDLYNTNNPRSVYSATGSNFYISGQGDGNTSDQAIWFANTGINTVTNTGTPPVAIYNAHDTRFVTQYNGNTYYSIDTSSGKFTGVQELTGSPTSLSTPTPITAGNNGKTGKNEVFYSPEGFYFANPTTLYVADTGVPKAGSVGDGGIQKWILNGSSWTLAYTLTPSNFLTPSAVATATSGESGFEAITGQIVGGNVDLYAVSYTVGDDNPDGLYSIADTLSDTTQSQVTGETFNEIETAAGNGGQVFKGVSFAPVPEPTTLSLLAGASAWTLLRRKRKQA